MDCSRRDTYYTVKNKDILITIILRTHHAGVDLIEFVMLNRMQRKSKLRPDQQCK